MRLAIMSRVGHSFRPEGVADPLRERLAEQVEKTGLEMLDPERILALAEDMGVVSRQRVHHAGLLIDSLILSALQRATAAAVPRRVDPRRMRVQARERVVGRVRGHGHRRRAQAARRL